MLVVCTERELTTLRRELDHIPHDWNFYNLNYNKKIAAVLPVTFSKQP